MSTGKIKTLFSDKERTEALFPRTKTSAVSDANGIGLDAILDGINTELDTKATQSFVTNKIAEAQVGGSGSGDIDLSGYATKDDLNSRVPTSRTVNDKALSSNITLSASDVGAAPSGYGLGLTTPTAITTTEDLDATKKCGFYRYAISNSVICGISFSSASMIVYSNTANSCVQELRPHRMNYCLRRNYVGGSTDKWSDWEEVGLVFKPLWENARPTSDFSAQTIALDLSGYDAVYIEAVRSTDSQLISGITMISVGGLPGYLMGTTNQLAMIRREVQATTTGVSVSAHQSANNSSGTSNEIPYRIYGIKNPHGMTKYTSD